MDYEEDDITRREEVVVMAAKELRRNHITRHCLFAIDGADDIDMLPTSTRTGSGDLIQSAICCIGSRAVAVSGKTYMLSGDDKWVEYSGGSGGGSGGGDEPGEYDYITDDDISDLFG